MRNALSFVLILTLAGCTSYPIEKGNQINGLPCAGNADLPETFAGKFEAVEDPDLLNQALGSPNQGKLCHGQVYQSKENARITLFRAWNSTNPNSKFGKWWAFQEPAGKVSTYRSEYEICYQWSPLDMLVTCTLKPQTKVVVGTGQSAVCSEYLTYPVSETKQIYIADPTQSVSDCKVSSGEFNWK